MGEYTRVAEGRGVREVRFGGVSERERDDEAVGQNVGTAEIEGVGRGEQ